MRTKAERERYTIANLSNLVGRIGEIASGTGFHSLQVGTRVRVTLVEAENTRVQVTTISDDEGFNRWVKYDHIYFEPNTLPELEEQLNSIENEAKELKDKIEYMKKNNCTSLNLLEYTVKKIIEKVKSSNESLAETMLVDALLQKKQLFT